MFDPNHPTGGDFVFSLVMLYLLVATLAWSWRNPTANPMTGLRYIKHVVNFEKMDQFQVPDSR